ncbi:MAG: MBL fold metallo-hydrolase [bacterium]
MKIRVLGSGTSDGVPSIGCHCPVCRSDDAKDRRSRSSVLVSHGGGNLLIDATTDLRWQSLAWGIERLDAVLFTHAHADHVSGIDEIRSFNKLQRKQIPAFGDSRTVQDIKRKFYYLFEQGKTGGGKADIRLEPVTGPFEVCGIPVRPLEIMHGQTPIYGYRIFDFAYLSDCSAIPEATYAQLHNLDVLILDALKKRPHSTHFSLDEAIEAAERIKAKRTFFTHICHEISHREDGKLLPEGMAFAYDGLLISTGFSGEAL